ncbi:omega-amidase NIT2-like [Phlebotomus argentipes]|uniref:omega-amidase NIT2-like n=1 Tax=Phlebotomus argentipes TaxID=94469 RepID=UPI002892F11C|nr:omega-amidase NIT2-like [Phlebotomus argentipes]
MSSAKKLRLALVQMHGSADKNANLKHAGDLIRQAVTKYDPHIVCLPEFFNAPYQTNLFRTYAEPIPEGPTSNFLSSLAKELNVHIVGGSIPEIDNEKLYNTCTLWSPRGHLVVKHRKVHLFDLNVPEVIDFKESSALTPGDVLTMAKIDPACVGFGICFDIQFPDMWMKYREKGCNLMIIPSAFPVKYGDRYWELYLRARAVDTQSYVTMISPARNVNANYVSHGFTMIVDPYGNVVASAKEGEETVFAEIDFSLVEKARKEIKLFDMRRTDMFELVLKSEE